MAKFTTLDTTLAPFLAQCDDVLNGSYCAVLFGSAARNEWVEGRSNINMLLVLDDARPATLQRLHRAFRTFADFSSEPPLLLSRAEWREAGDAFPLEITDMRIAYKVLRGDDPMAEAQPSRDDLRRALEREFRGKLLQLRRGFVAYSDNELALGALAMSSIKTFVLLSRCALVLLREPVPATSSGVVERAAARLGFDRAPLALVLSKGAAMEWRCPVEDFVRYLAAVEAAVHAVDQLSSEA